MSEPVLAARDAEDLEVLSAKLQDAVARVGDFVYLKKQHRFVALFNRFMWETGKQNVRVRSGLHFDCVLRVRCRNMRQGTDDAVVELLAIRFCPSPESPPAGTVELLFAGDGSIVLEVECLEAALTDSPEMWAARARPRH